MSRNHWGEIVKQPISDFLMPNVTTDIERSMDKFCLAEYQDDGDILKTENIFIPSMDPLMLYSISLHKYMIELSRTAECAKESNITPPTAPPLPIMPDINIRPPKNNFYIPKDPTPFSCSTEFNVPELSEAIVKKILTKCVATMFAHVGYENTHASVLDVLTDVLEAFFHKICHKVVEATEDEEKGSGSGFPHVIERVLTETGMGGVSGINDYYQNRVIKYVNVLQKRCQELLDQYESLQIPDTNIQDEQYNNVSGVKLEDDVPMDTQNPEVHFTSFDGESSVLEMGYQLLNSLEAEENLQVLDKTEDTSPGVSSISSEADSLSPFTKKKRFK